MPSDMISTTALRRGHGSVAARVGLGAGLGLLLALAACSTLQPEVRRSERVLPPRIEGVAVPPLETAAGASMNELDREFLRQQIRTRIDTHVPMRGFDAPPSTLPSIAILSGEITQFRVDELRGEPLFVRTVELRAEFKVIYQASEEPPHRFSREYSYQRAYPAGQQVATELFDVQNALIEFAQLVDAEFYPSTDLDRFSPATAYDEDSGLVAPVRALAAGNEHASHLRFGPAVRFWRLALFDPNGQPSPRLFKPTRLSVALLREEGVPEKTLQVLEEEFLDASPRDLIAFREDLRDELGSSSKFENRIGELSLHHESLAHMNLAAAHENLGRLSLAQRKLDLAAYHHAMAWAHSRDPNRLDAWKAIQTGRQLIPGGLNDVQAIRLFLGQPPPATARHLPGSFDDKVLPHSTVREEGIAAIIQRAGGIAVNEPQAPVEVQLEPVPLEPLPPAQESAPPGAQGAARPAANARAGGAGQPAASQPAGAPQPAAPRAAQQPAPPANR